MQLSREQLKQQLVEHYRWLRQYGCNDSHSGNASFRWHDEVWVKPTGCCADTLQADDLVKCLIDGAMEEKASLDAALHIQTNQQNPDARALFHSHNPYTVAITLDGQDFVPVVKVRNQQRLVQVLLKRLPNYLIDQKYS